MPVNRTLALCLGVIAIAVLSGCSDSGSGDVPGPLSETLSVVEDVTGQDGADAVSTLEAQELEAVFDPDRDDATGCEVTDQDPVAGTELDPEVDILEVTLTLDCRQVDWENQEGDDWDTFNDAYSSGFDEGCDIAFEGSPDGTFYYEDEEFTSLDCQSNNPGDASGADLPSEVPEDPESDGTELGQQDGCESAFDVLSSDGSLYYGDEQFSSLDCPVSASVAPSRPKTKAGLTARDYRVPKSTWDQYSSATQRKLADLFVANNPSDCRAAITTTMTQYVEATWGSDYPDSALASDVMLGFCELSRYGE